MLAFPVQPNKNVLSVMPMESNHKPNFMSMLHAHSPWNLQASPQPPPILMTRVMDWVAVAL